MGSFSSTSSVDLRFEPRHLLPQRFEIIRFLGEGGSAVVLNCYDTSTKQNVAVKFAKGKYKLKHEAEMMRYLMKHKLDEKNIIKFHDSLSSTSCLVFEMCDINLKDYIKQRFPLKLQEIRTVIQQLATALEGLKKVKIIHSDLKTNNIMVVDERKKPLQVKLIDFGLALHARHSNQTINQCLFYKAPELILGLPYSAALDIWSLGCVVGKMLLNYVLFPGNTEYENSPMEYWGHEYHKYKRSLNFRFLHQAKMSHLKYEKLAATDERRECIALMKAMLHWDAKKRITPKGILSHSFIVQKSSSPRNSFPEYNVPIEQEPCTSKVTAHSNSEDWRKHSFFAGQNMRDVKGKRGTYDIALQPREFDKKLPPRPRIKKSSREQLSKLSVVENRLLLQKRNGERPTASSTLESTKTQDTMDPRFVPETALSQKSSSRKTHRHRKSKQKNFFENICRCWRRG
ncbi:homeodomain-interacting protein kinase 1-like isoform X2 [Poeciliopsis prolifica]|uniref:homeodomain-interacting protein kinase 1-like isoform X2 n=1 Tax=Poeciliopsis prolifica TaxID=188132 RepID=UPI0024135641|nr:homeodomain-interacting protein kinase 1-like isoform X2 [Poeciliopsis prolifica]